MFRQLDPPIPLHVLEKGAGQAIAVIDYGAEHHLVWVTAIDETGEIWCAPNTRVRMQSNWTLARDTSPAVRKERTSRPDGERPAGQLCDNCDTLMRLGPAQG